MTSFTKKDLEKPISGLFFMIINTTIWGFIAEYYLANKDFRIVGLVLGVIVLSFVYYYVTFGNAKKNLIENTLEKSAEEKSKDQWFLIIFGLEGIAIPITKIVLDNTNLSQFFIPSFALIVGLHFFPLAKIFDRKFDYFMGTWTCCIAFVGFVFIQQKTTTVAIANALVSLGCAIATISYGVKMIYEGKRLLKNQNG